MTLDERANRLAPYILSLVRILVALLFLEHGCRICSDFRRRARFRRRFP
jgi:hypothetical protein